MCSLKAIRRPRSFPKVFGDRQGDAQEERCPTHFYLVLLHHQYLAHIPKAQLQTIYQILVCRPRLGLLPEATTSLSPNVGLPFYILDSGSRINLASQCPRQILQLPLRTSLT